MRAPQRWLALPAWARWILVYAALAALAALVGWITPLGVGNAYFLTGALLILASATLIRTGGQRKRVVARDIRGRPLRREPVEPEKRRREISVGLGLFLLGLALWAPLVVLYLAR